MLLKIDSHPKRSLLLIATDDLPDLRLVELVPLLTAQVQPARLRIVLFLEDQPGHDRLQALLMAGVGVICRLQRFQGPLLASAINNALLNRPWLDPHYETLRQPGGRPRPGGRWLRHPGDLPWRERELLCQVGQGYNALEISQRLGIRCDTVRRTLSRVYKRIGVRDRAQAVGWCLCHGLISSQELRRRYPLHGSLEDQP
jgi:DNA-binding NarL/FixJ family response regulator